MEITHRRAGVIRDVRSALACILAAVALPVAGSAQQASFTAAQAEAGATVYQTACAECHLANLQGSGEAPQLAGTDVRTFRGNQPAVELMRYVRTTMPPGQEGSLTEEEYAAVTAYIMRENGVAQGSAPLSLASRGSLVLGGGGCGCGWAGRNHPAHSRTTGNRTLTGGSELAAGLRFPLGDSNGSHPNV